MAECQGAVSNGRDAASQNRSASICQSSARGDHVGQEGLFLGAHRFGPSLGSSLLGRPRQFICTSLPARSLNFLFTFREVSVKFLLVSLLFSIVC